MRRPSTCLLLMLFLIATSTLSSSSSHTSSNRNESLQNSINKIKSAGCLSHERDALLAFKQGIISDPAGRLASWQQAEKDCCLWRGVHCSNRTGHIIGLRLSSVQGDLEDTALFGQISPSLLSLQRLQHLDLSMNDLSGPTSHLPSFLGLLKNLRYLDLSGIPFTGMVPPELGNLSKLHYFHLSPDNIFTMSIPNLYSNDISWLTNLPLRYLRLDYVNLSSEAHWANVLNMVPSLRSVSLTGCSLTSANQSLPYLNISDLTELTLSDNYFYHPVTSCWFWNLTNLQLLYLSRTELYGKIPQSLGRMMSLQVLGLSHNDGHIDITTANLTNLCNLECLDLSYNKLNGDIVELSEVLPQCWPNKLEVLDLGGNNLTGALPKWIGQRWPSLRFLLLYSNQLTGPVPSEISMLNNLTCLDLSCNGLNGLITREHLAGLANLKYIDLSYTTLKIVLDLEWSPPFRLECAYFASCPMGPSFPSWLQSQTDIVDLNITRASIVDRLPDWFTTTFLKARRVDISNNVISGTLPVNFKNWTSLRKIYLNSNNLDGPIPQLPTLLFEFVGSENSFSGPLPSNFGTRGLRFINIASNRITGHIPWSVCQLKQLFQLNLANNLLEGEFPQCFQSKTARILILRNNKLSGKFPATLKTWTDLYILDLAWNMFVGRLPMWIGDFAELKIVDLSHNMFNGSIPAAITRLGNLSYLSLAGNGISGHLPRHLSNLTGMRRTYNPTSYDNNPFNSFPAHVNLSVITKGQERSYKDVIVYEIVSIDFSSNQLTGRIPDEITSLDGVINMNLSWNLLSGNIPGKIGLMQSLESLDLKENKLYGEIPQTMSSLTYLSVLDLSYNNLTGSIPSGGQLDTLYQQNPFMYDGNGGLCGYPLQKNCSNSIEPKLGDKKKHEHDSKVLTFWFGLCVGYVVGLWVVFCVILFVKAWRLAYFHLFDKVYGFVFARVFISE